MFNTFYFPLFSTDFYTGASFLSVLRSHPKNSCTYDLLTTLWVMGTALKGVLIMYLGLAMLISCYLFLFLFSWTLVLIVYGLRCSKIFLFELFLWSVWFLCSLGWCSYYFDVVLWDIGRSMLKFVAVLFWFFMFCFLVLLSIYTYIWTYNKLTNAVIFIDDNEYYYMLECTTQHSSKCNKICKHAIHCVN